MCCTSSTCCSSHGHETSLSHSGTAAVSVLDRCRRKCPSCSLNILGFMRTNFSGPLLMPLRTIFLIFLNSLWSSFYGETPGEVQKAGEGKERKDGQETKVRLRKQCETEELMKQEDVKGERNQRRKGPAEWWNNCDWHRKVELTGSGQRKEYLK